MRFTSSPPHRGKTVSKLFALELLGLASLSEKQIPQIVETIRNAGELKEALKPSGCAQGRCATACATARQASSLIKYLREPCKGRTSQPWQTVMKPSKPPKPWQDLSFQQFTMMSSRDNQLTSAARTGWSYGLIVLMDTLDGRTCFSTDLFFTVSLASVEMSGLSKRPTTLIFWYNAHLGEGGWRLPGWM